MTHSKDHVDGHLEAAKDEVKAAAQTVVDKAKDKVVEAVDKLHTAAHKDDHKK